MSNIYLLGGTDAPGGYFDANGVWHPTPGWEAGSRLELVLAVEILQRVAQLKTPGLSKSISGDLIKFVHKEVSTYAKDGGIIVINAGRQQFM